MAIRDDPFTGNDMTLKVYRWAEKEVASGDINGTNTTFTVSNTIANVTELDSNPLPDYKDANGNVALRDVAVYYRKNGVDTRVDESEISSISGTTITFVTAPTTSQADSIVVSYAYVSSDDGVTDFTYYVTKYDPKWGSKDVKEYKVCGNRSYKITATQGLTELSITAVKKDVLLSQLLAGDVVTTTTEVSGYKIQTVTGGSTATARCVVLKHTDPDNANEFLIYLMRNVSASDVSLSGGAEDALEETITIKANPQDTAEITKEAT